MLQLKIMVNDNGNYKQDSAQCEEYIVSMVVASGPRFHILILSRRSLFSKFVKTSFFPRPAAIPM